MLDDYRAIKAALDKTLLNLDRLKLDVDLGKFDKSNEAPASDAGFAPPDVSTVSDAPFSPPAAPAPPAQPAAWLPDPHGRHHYRCWDGTRWTEHVATNGTQSVDPVG